MDATEQDFQIIMSHYLVMETKLRSSAKSISLLTTEPSSQTQNNIIIFRVVIEHLGKLLGKANKLKIQVNKEDRNVQLLVQVSRDSGNHRSISNAKLLSQIEKKYEKNKCTLQEIVVSNLSNWKT